MDEDLIVVGDIHGDAQRLLALLPPLVSSGRRLVFLGDYVNRGAEGRAVLDALCDLREDLCERVVVLAGNHDIALLNYLANGDLPAFAAHGGIPTIRSYLGQVHGDVHEAFVRRFPAKHRALLESLLPCWESEGILVSHTGYDPLAPWDRSLHAMALTGHPQVFSTPAPSTPPPVPLVVCGHYVQPGGQPYVSKNLICLDTGCGTCGGPLTALMLPERRVFTS